MRYYKIKSYATVNISLKLLRKLKSNLHKIESNTFGVTTDN